MKKYLFIFLSFAILSGCATTKDTKAVVQETETIAEKETAQSFETIKYKKAVVNRETRKYRNGEIDIYTVYEYENGTENLASSITYDSADEIMESVKVENKSGLSIFNYFDRDSNLLKTKTVSIDANSNITAVFLEDSRGNQISRSSFEYENNNKVKWEIFDSSDSLLAYNIYLYDQNSNNIEIKSFSPSDSLEEYFINEFDSNGNLISMKHYNSSGKILDSSKHLYTGDWLKEEEFYKGEKSLTRKIIYDYNDDFTKQEKKVYMPDGQIIEIIEKKYFYIEKEKKINGQGA